MADQYDGGRPRDAFALFVRTTRSRLSLTQGELARRVGWALTTIQAIEQGKREPGLDLVAALFEALNIPSAFRAPILSVLRPGLTEAVGQQLPNILFSGDHVDLAAYPYPVLILDPPLGDVIGANPRWLEITSGLQPGGNLLAFLLSDEGQQMSPDALKYAHGLVYGLRVLGPTMAPREDVQRVIDMCKHHPDWKEMWASTPTQLEGVGQIRLRDQNDQLHSFMLRIDNPALPPRSWLTYRFVPLAAPVAA
ncbi:helix-turn-helix transcriptional regulator [Nocardia sp. NPDC055002]